MASRKYHVKCVPWPSFDKRYFPIFDIFFSETWISPKNSKIQNASLLFYFPDDLTVCKSFLKTFHNRGKLFSLKIRLSLTLTSMCGKGPREFSGTLMGGMTQSLFCRLKPLAEEPLRCLRENLITLGWDSHTRDSISSKPTWKGQKQACHTENINSAILNWLIETQKLVYVTTLKK